MPTCQSDCIFSTCTSPNECSCYEGYKKDIDGSCKPVCDNCTNGKCVGPNECKCNDGYKMNRLLGVCIPDCPGGCFNGICVSPNHCECREGYLMDFESQGKYI